MSSYELFSSSLYNAKIDPYFVSHKIAKLNIFLFNWKFSGHIFYYYDFFTWNTRFKKNYFVMFTFVVWAMATKGLNCIY